MTMKVYTRQPDQCMVVGVAKVGEPSHDCNYTETDGWSPGWAHPGHRNPVRGIFANCNTPEQDADKLLHFHGYCFCEVNPENDMARDFLAAEPEEVWHAEPEEVVHEESRKRPRGDDPGSKNEDVSHVFKSLRI